MSVSRILVFLLICAIAISVPSGDTKAQQAQDPADTVYSTDAVFETGRRTRRQAQNAPVPGVSSRARRSERPVPRRRPLGRAGFLRGMGGRLRGALLLQQRARRRPAAHGR